MRKRAHGLGGRVVKWVGAERMVVEKMTPNCLLEFASGGCESILFSEGAAKVENVSELNPPIQRKEISGNLPGAGLKGRPKPETAGRMSPVTESN